MKHFTILLSFFFLFTLRAVSQIVYTDLTISGFQQGYGVDFNDDDKIDVHITLLSNYGVWVMHLIPDSDTDLTYVVYDGEEASVLEEEDDISSSSNLYQLGSGWGGLLYGYWETSGEYGNWTGTQEDKYLGIKFEIEGSFHYAWIQLTTHIYAYDNMDFTVKSYAYNTVANEGIEAGDQGNPSTVIETKDKQISVFPNPAKNVINIETQEEILEIVITDINGNELYYSDKSAFEMRQLIDISHFRDGLYLLRVSVDEGMYLTKFMKQ